MTIKLISFYIFVFNLVLIKHMLVWLNLVFNLKFTVLALDSEVNLFLSLQDQWTLIMMLIKMKIKIKI